MSSGQPGEVILETESLCRYFGGVRAAHDISLRIRRGAITSLIGPNGAGKTTVFNAVTGIFPPSAGDVVVHHPERGVRSLVGRRPDQICDLGLARTFQNIRLFPDLPVIDNVKVGLHPRTRCGVLSSILRLPRMLREADEIEAAALRYLEFVGLLDRAHDLATNLAYGEQRLLEIGRALATHPQLLLLDEPAAGMNPAETDELMALIRKICRCGGTVFLIEHDMKLVMNISDYVYVMDHGELISQGPPADVQADPKVVEAYLGVQEEEGPAGVGAPAADPAADPTVDPTALDPTAGAPDELGEERHG